MPDDKLKNVRYFDLVLALNYFITFFFAIAPSEFYFLPLSFFSAILLPLALAFMLHILSGCRKKLGVYYGKT